MATILITGASRRLGAAMARGFHLAGYRVLIHCNHGVDEANELADNLNTLRSSSAAVYQADLMSLADIKKLGQQLRNSEEGLSLLINNASTFYSSSLADLNTDHWDQLIGVNMKAPLLLVQEMIAGLQQMQGNVINMADVHAFRPLAGYGLYSAAKAGLIALTHSMAAEFAPEVRVNAIAPGAILWPESGPDEEILSKIPLERLGTPEDIVKTAMFLNDSPYVTGQVICVDGGRTLNQ